MKDETVLIALKKYFESLPSKNEAANNLSEHLKHNHIPGSFYAADGYEQLADVLVAAHDQAAHGKGKERHANDLPFHEQRMQSISKLIGSPKGLEFQAIKKLTEGMQFDDAAHREKELLGAINYIAGIIIYYRNEEGVL